jgi:hypothetical protein
VSASLRLRAQNEGPLKGVLRALLVCLQRPQGAPGTEPPVCVFLWKHGRRCRNAPSLFLSRWWEDAGCKKEVMEELSQKLLNMYNKKTKSKASDKKVRAVAAVANLASGVFLGGLRVTRDSCPLECNAFCMQRCLLRCALLDLRLS